MPYQCDLGPGQTIYLDNPGPNTLITLASGSPGQQQQSTTQMQTGTWLEIPQVVQGEAGLLIRCVAAQGTFVWQIQGTQIRAIAATQWPEGEALPMALKGGSPNSMPPMAPMPPMTPMAPMSPMKMGDMEMSANPMTMRMGNMQLSMDNAASAPPASAKFCTQCGAVVGEGDRFCGSCGHHLS